MGAVRRARRRARGRTSCVRPRTSPSRPCWPCPRSWSRSRCPVMLVGHGGDPGEYGHRCSGAMPATPPRNTMALAGWAVIDVDMNVPFVAVHPRLQCPTRHRPARRSCWFRAHFASGRCATTTAIIAARVAADDRPGRNDPIRGIHNRQCACPVSAAEIHLQGCPALIWNDAVASGRRDRAPVLSMRHEYGAVMFPPTSVIVKAPTACALHAPVTVNDGGGGGGGLTQTSTRSPRAHWRCRAHRVSTSQTTRSC